MIYGRMFAFVEFSLIFSTKPRDRVKRTPPKRPILCRVGRKTQSINRTQCHQITVTYKQTYKRTDRQTTDRQRDIRVFSIDVSMLLIGTGSRHCFTNSRLHRQQHVLQFSLLTKDEVKFLIQSCLINLHTFHVGVQLSYLHTHTHMQTHQQTDRQTDKAPHVSCN